MKSAIVKTIIAGAVIMGIGLAVVLLAGGLNGWNFRFDGKWEQQKYEYAEAVTDIDIDFSAGSLQIEFYDGEQIEVEYSSSERFTTEFNVVNNTLRMSTSQAHWYSTFLWFNKIPETKMYVPRSWQLNFDVVVNAGAVNFAEGGNYGNVYVRMNAGVISMERINCSSIDLEINAGTMNATHIVSDICKAELNAGSLNIRALQCDDIDLDLSAGSANIGIAGYKHDYTIRANVSAGSCNVSSQNGGRKQLKVDVSAGSATIQFAEE